MSGPPFLEDSALKLILFGGKGGVGKTTCAAATAFHMAHRQGEKNFLLVSTDPAHSLVDIIQAPPSPGNIEIIELNSQQCLEAFKTKYERELREIATRGTFLDGEDIERLLGLSLPGLDELMAFLEISRLVEQEEYECIIVDTAPTGHTMRLLTMPELTRKWLKALDTLLAKHRYMKKLFSGFYRCDETDEFLLNLATSIERLDALLRDPVRCRFVPVMIAEKLGVHETKLLIEDLVRLQIPVREVVVNRIIPETTCPLCTHERNLQMDAIEIFLLSLPKMIESWKQGLSSLPHDIPLAPLKGGVSFNLPHEEGVPCSPTVEEGISFNSPLQEDISFNSPLEGSQGNVINSSVLFSSRYGGNTKHPLVEERSSGDQPDFLWQVPLYSQEIRGRNHLEVFWDGATRFLFSRGPDIPMPVSRGIRVHNPAAFPGEELTIIFFAGKGGVGKTTLACATALRLAHDLQNEKVFLFSVDPAHSLSTCLAKPVGPLCTGITHGLTAMEINAQLEFNSLKSLYQEELEAFFDGVLSNFDLVFDREVMEKLLDLSPSGLDEVMAMTRIVDLIEEGDYDVFIVDAPPTGHFIRLLELPEVIDQWLKVFFHLFLKYKRVFRLPTISHRLVRMSKNLKRLRCLLSQPSRSSVFTVSIPTEMALEETLDLVNSCERIGIDTPVLFLNLVTPGSDCPVCSPLHQRESRVRSKFQALFAGMHQTVIDRATGPCGLQELLELGEMMYRPRYTQIDSLTRRREDAKEAKQPVLRDFASSRET